MIFKFAFNVRSYYFSSLLKQRSLIVEYHVYLIIHFILYVLKLENYTYILIPRLVLKILIMCTTEHFLFIYTYWYQAWLTRRPIWPIWKKSSFFASIKIGVFFFSFLVCIFLCVFASSFFYLYIYFICLFI